MLHVHCLISEAFSFMWNSEFHTNSTLRNSIFHTMDLMFHNVEHKKLHTSSTQNALNMFYYDHWDSTQFPHLFHILVPHYYHTNSTFSFEFHIMEKGKNCGPRLPQFFHCISTVHPHFKHIVEHVIFSSANDRIWPSEYSFEVSFGKSLFVFEISAFKVRNSAGSILGFTRFPKILIGKPLPVTSQMIKLLDQYRARDRTQVETAKFDSFWKKLWFINYDCLMVVGKRTAFPSTHFMQITKEGSKP